MNPGRRLPVLIIFLLILAGCGVRERTGRDREEEAASHKPQAASHKPQATSLRLQAASRKPQAASCKLQVLYAKDLLPDTSEYYRPGYVGERLDKLDPLRKVLPGRQHDHWIISSDQKSNLSEQVVLKRGHIAEKVFFTATWDNDLFDNTDIYFTNGAGFGFYHPVISALPFTRLLPGLNFGINYYGLTLTQNLYTPLKLNKPEILLGDRPFASYLVIGLNRVSLSPEKCRRLHTEISLGVIGPGSLGNFSQALIHSEEPIGWRYQVENDFVANYSFRFDQGIFSRQGFELAVVAGGQAGTLYDNIAGGIFLQFGRANDRYQSIFQTTEYQKPYGKRIKYYFSLDLTNKMIIYDATLQGGLSNDKSVYTIDGQDMKRYVFTGTAGFGIGLGRYSLEASQFFLTPEFEGGRHHMWFRIRNIIQLN